MGMDYYRLSLPVKKKRGRAAKFRKVWNWFDMLGPVAQLGAHPVGTPRAGLFGLSCHGQPCYAMSVDEMAGRVWSSNVPQIRLLFPRILNEGKSWVRGLRTMWFSTCGTALALMVFSLLNGEPEAISKAIRDLGSADYRTRQKATDWLLARPDSVAALRDALKPPDSEVARRAALVLDHLDRRPVRELESAIGKGSVEHTIEILASWPSGKYEEQAWSGVCKLTSRLLQLHQAKSGG